MTATATLDDARATFRANLKQPKPRRFAKRDDTRHPLDVLEEHGLFTVYDFSETTNLGPAQSIRMIHRLHREKLVESTPFVGQYRVAPRQGCAQPAPVNPCTALVPVDFYDRINERLRRVGECLSPLVPDYQRLIDELSLKAVEPCPF